MFFLDLESILIIPTGKTILLYLHIQQCLTFQSILNIIFTVLFFSVLGNSIKDSLWSFLYIIHKEQFPNHYNRFQMVLENIIDSEHQKKSVIL